MCQYCGCQEIAVIDELTREHDEVVARIGQIREHLAHGALDDAVAGCRQILAILGPHTVVEERGLFPAMRAEFPDHVETLEREHRQIEEVLGECARAVPTDPTWPDRLLGVLFLLREHILREQDGAFPAALTVLDAASWERVEAVRAVAGGALAGAAAGAAGPPGIRSGDPTGRPTKGPARARVRPAAGSAARLPAGPAGASRLRAVLVRDPGGHPRPRPRPSAEPA